MLRGLELHSIDLEELRRSVDKVVTLFCTDGEVISAKIILVCEEDEEVVYEMLATNREKKQAYAKAGIGAVYVARFCDVERIGTTTSNSLRG